VGKQVLCVYLGQWFVLLVPPDQGTVFKFSNFAGSEEALSFSLRLLSLLHCF
jgi:hypothetical protein